MARINVDSTILAGRLLSCFHTILEESGAVSHDMHRDLDTLKIFANSPELTEAKAAADRLRSSTADMHPFADRVITTALEELGL